MRLGVWAQVDAPEAAGSVERMLAAHAHPGLKLEIQLFGGSRQGLALAVAQANLRREYDRILYMHVNQSVLALWPGHAPYAIWLHGIEVFADVPRLQRRALKGAAPLLSSSQYTADRAAQSVPNAPRARAVHLCIEPPMQAAEDEEDLATREAYRPEQREPAALIVGSMYRSLLYKGHQQLIAAWPQVVAECPAAELWIVGQGDGRPELEALAHATPHAARRQIHFLGQLDDEALQARYRRCRVFAMPSAGEGFGLVYIEAARYGVPCIAGRHDAAHEIVIDGETGLLVDQEPPDVAQACLRLLTDDELARRLGEAGRRRYVENNRFQHFRQRLLSTLSLE